MKGIFHFNVDIPASLKHQELLRTAKDLKQHSSWNHLQSPSDNQKQILDCLKGAILKIMTNTKLTPVVKQIYNLQFRVSKLSAELNPKVSK